MTVKALFSAVAQCDGKKQFRSKKLAKRSARHHETMLGGGRLESYRCPHCGWFHNGHRPHNEVVSARVED